jgi:hypothetical protein
MKKKTITLEDLRSVNSNPDHAFRVQKVVNSTEFTVGQLVSKREADNLCLSAPWTVNLVAKK